MIEEVEKEKIELDKNFLLENVKNQIALFDNKASILIGIVGIAFSITILSKDNIDKINGSQKTAYLIFMCLYFVSFIVTMILLIAVIYPRKKKKENTFDVSYYKDVAKLDKKEFLSKINSSDYDYDDSMKNQIYVNCTICNKKHKLFVIAVWSLIPLVIFLITSLLLLVF